MQVGCFMLQAHCKFWTGNWGCRHSM